MNRCNLMLFTGVYELTLDEKHRLIIPSSVRAGLDPEIHGARLYLAPGDRDRTMYLYPEKEFERYVEKNHASLAPGPDQLEFELVYYSLVTPLELDKAGRIMIPQRAVDRAGLGKEVVLSGARNRFVLWNRADHQAFMERNGPRCPDLLQKAQMNTAILGNGHGNS
jgi:MraZ protein